MKDNIISRFKKKFIKIYFNIKIVMILQLFNIITLCTSKPCVVINHFNSQQLKCIHQQHFLVVPVSLKVVDFTSCLTLYAYMD